VPEAEAPHPEEMKDSSLAPPHRRPKSALRKRRRRVGDDDQEEDHGDCAGPSQPRKKKQVRFCLGDDDESGGGGGGPEAAVASVQLEQGASQPMEAAPSSGRASTNDHVDLLLNLGVLVPETLPGSPGHRSRAVSPMLSDGLPHSPDPCAQALRAAEPVSLLPDFFSAFASSPAAAAAHHSPSANAEADAEARPRRRRTGRGARDRSAAQSRDLYRVYADTDLGAAFDIEDMHTVCLIAPRRRCFSGQRADTYSHHITARVCVCVERFSFARN